MQNKGAPFAATPDATHGRQPQATVAPSGAAAGGQSDAGTEETDVRLVIEEDQASGAYIYKTYDRRTGEVLKQFPREEILEMRDRVGYHAGGVIRTKA
jgi:flagellar protein FlaG